MRDDQGRATDAVSVVARACAAAQQLQERRAGASRRVLGKSIGVSRDVIAGIEDCSLAPTAEQLRRLSDGLDGFSLTGFDPVVAYGQVPWKEAITQLIAPAGELTFDAIVSKIAARDAGCEPEHVSWRLHRQLKLLQRSGLLEQTRHGTWLMQPADPPSPGARKPGRTARWASAGIGSRHDPEVDAAFHLESRPGELRIVLNEHHPLFEAFAAALHPEDAEACDAVELRARYSAVCKLVRALLVAWAELEDGEKEGARRERVREVRQQWGRLARHTAGAVGTGPPGTGGPDHVAVVLTNFTASHEVPPVSCGSPAMGSSSGPEVSHPEDGTIAELRLRGETIAWARVGDGGDVRVLAGSRIARDGTASQGKHVADLRRRLLEAGCLVELDDSWWKLTVDQEPLSPSTAAALVVGYSINGRIAWQPTRVTVRKDGSDVRPAEAPGEDRYTAAMRRALTNARRPQSGR